MSERVCPDRAHLLGAFLDGVLEPAHQLEIEAHVERCEGCRERVMLDKAIRGSMRRECRAPASEALKARVAAAMRAQAAPPGASTRPTRRAIQWQAVVPLASAAAVALAWSAMSRGPLARTTTGDSLRAGFGDELLAELVAEHGRPSPPECTDPRNVRQLEQYVGVPVHPASFQGRQAKLVGGCVLPVRRERAAMLRYEIEGGGGETRRVSIIVFDPKRIQVSDDALRARPVGTAQVRVGRSNGYSVAVTQRAGVGYAVATDLDEGRAAELALATDE